MVDGSVFDREEGKNLDFDEVILDPCVIDFHNIKGGFLSGGFVGCFEGFFLESIRILCTETCFIDLPEVRG